MLYIIIMFNNKTVANTFGFLFAKKKPRCLIPQGKEPSPEAEEETGTETKQQIDR